MSKRRYRTKTLKAVCNATQVTTQASGGKTADRQEAVENTRDYKGKFPIVGIGASAGGLSAFETFFSSMPG